MPPMLTGGVNWVSIVPPPDNMVDSASIIKIEEYDTVLMTLAFEFFFKTNGQIDRFIERFSLFFIFAKVRNYLF